MSPTLAVLPLSPERACASQRSWTLRARAADLVDFCRVAVGMVASFSRLQNIHLHALLDLPPIDERGPVRHYFLHGRTAPGEPGDARRPGQHQRRDLPGEPLHRAALPGADADAKLDFGKIRRRR